MGWQELAKYYLPAGGWGVFLLLVIGLLWMLSSGRLVTRAQMEQMERDRDGWRAATERQDARNDELARQVGLISSQMASLEQFMRSTVSRVGRR